MQIGQVVISLAGRDAGYPAAVVGRLGGMFLICDGKERPLENPKRKNPKHLTVTEYVLSSEQMRSNKSLKTALRAIGDGIVKEDLLCQKRI